MKTHSTTIGDGAAIVDCQYHFDSDGDLDELKVMFHGVDIRDALTDSQLEEIEAECLAAAESDYQDSKDDARIERYIADLEYA